MSIIIKKLPVSLHCFVNMIQRPVISPFLCKLISFCYFFVMNVLKKYRNIPLQIRQIFHIICLF